MDMKELALKLIKDLEASKTARHVFFLGTSYTHKHLEKSEILKVAEVSDYLDKNGIGLNTAQRIELCKHLGQYIPKQVKQPSEALKELIESDLELFYDIDNKDFLLVRDKELSIYPPDFYFNKLGRDEAQVFKATAKPCRSVFNHKNTYRFKEVTSDKESYTLFNRYRERWWMREEFKEVYRELPEDFQYFLEQAVPNAVSREHLLSWTANAFQDFNHTILNNRGERGAGKSLYTEIIAKVLGYATPALSVQSPFDGEKRDKRLIYYEDSTYIGSPNGYMIRKNLTDTTKLLNLKHHQAAKSEILYTSYAINSNVGDMFYNEYDDRKSVYIDWTHKNIGTLDDPKLQRILDFYATMKNEEEENYSAEQREKAIHIGLFFMNYSPSISPTTFIHNDEFYKDIVQSLPMFKRYVMEKIILDKMEEVDYSDMKSQFRQDNALAKGAAHTNYFMSFVEFFDKHFLYRKEKVFTGYDEERCLLFVNPLIHKDKEVDSTGTKQKIDMGGFNGIS
jgi:hypothetical protein